MPSEYTTRTRTRFNALCIENYKLEMEIIKLNISKHNSDAMESWRKKKVSRRMKKNTFSFYSKPKSNIFEEKKGLFNKRNYFYYININIFCIFNQFVKSKKQIFQIFSIKMLKRSLIVKFYMLS